YSPREIALAAGVSEDQVRRALAGPAAPPTVDGYLRHGDAVRLGRALRPSHRDVFAPALAATQVLALPARSPLFSMFAERGASERNTTVPLAVSSTLHLGLMAVVVFITTFNLAPHAETIVNERAEPLRLVFVATPGPGGGGGGGGLHQRAPAPKA